MDDEIGEVVAKWLKPPEGIIKHKRKALQRAVEVAAVSRAIKEIGTKEPGEILPAFNQKVALDQPLVIPDKRISQRIGIDNYS